jgi:hypothetical protein
VHQVGDKVILWFKVNQSSRQFNIFRESSCPWSGAYKLQSPPLVYHWNVVVAVLLVVVGPVVRPRPTTLLPPCSNGKPEAATAVDKLLIMGLTMPETCWAVFKRQAINLRDWWIWLVYLFEYMMMHGLTNPKHSTCFGRSFRQSWGV